MVIGRYICYILNYFSYMNKNYWKKYNFFLGGGGAALSTLLLAIAHQLVSKPTTSTSSLQASLAITTLIILKLCKINTDVVYTYILLGVDYRGKIIRLSSLAEPSVHFYLI